MSIGAGRSAVGIMNRFDKLTALRFSKDRQITLSVVTNLWAIRVQFLSHQSRIAYALIIYVGSGLTKEILQEIIRE